MFDTGGFFGVGVPEATVVALLAWFLLGPEELFRLAKAAGSWLGEARGFVGEAAKKYESTLDDASTRKAIAGIRETQRTVSEVASSFQAISGTIRDPLNLSSTLSDTFAKYDDKKEETSKSSSSTDAQASKPQQPSGAKEETPEELERKRAASQNSAKDLFFSGATKDASSAIGSEDVLARLDARLEQVDRLVEELEELKKGVLRDQETVRVLMDPSPSAKKPELAGTAAASPEQTKAHEPAKKPARALE